MSCVELVTQIGFRKSQRGFDFRLTQWAPERVGRAFMDLTVRHLTLERLFADGGREHAFAQTNQRVS